MTHDATELTESEVGSLGIVNDSVIKCFRHAMATTFLSLLYATSSGEVREEVRVQGLQNCMVFFQNNNIDHQPAAATPLVSAEGRVS